MALIKFPKDEKVILVKKLQDYMHNELDHDIGQFDADFFLDFITEKMGVYFYNQGLYDAQTILNDKIESISEAIYEIEQPTEFQK